MCTLRLFDVEAVPCLTSLCTYILLWSPGQLPNTMLGRSKFSEGISRTLRAVIRNLVLTAAEAKCKKIKKICIKILGKYQAGSPMEQAFQFDFSAYISSIAVLKLTMQALNHVSPGILLLCLETMGLYWTLRALKPSSWILFPFFM